MTTVLAVALSLVFLPLGLAKIAAVPVMRRAAAHLGMPTGFYRVVGALEVAGVAGLLLGLTWTPLGVAAAPGLAPDMTSAAEEIAVRRLTKSSPPAPITTPMTQ